MIGKLTRLPFRVAHKVARRIQDREEQRLAELHAAKGGGDNAATRSGPAIPAHELAELSSDEVSLTASEVLGLNGAAYGLVDVRRAAAGKRPAVDGATRIPLEELMIRLAELPAGTRLLTIDDTGADALTAALFLRNRGFDMVFALRGGLGAWRAAGGETTQG